MHTITFVPIGYVWRIDHIYIVNICIHIFIQYINFMYFVDNGYTPHRPAFLHTYKHGALKKHGDVSTLADH